MSDLEREERAFSLLQWIPYCLLAQYDEELGMLGHYTSAQAERSGIALDEFDKKHPFKTSDELTAFRELERLGVYGSKDFFSPSKAKNGHYTRRLKQHSDDTGKPQGSQRAFKQARSTRKHGPL